MILSLNYTSLRVTKCMFSVITASSKRPLFRTDWMLIMNVENEPVFKVTLLSQILQDNINFWPVSIQLN